MATAWPRVVARLVAVLPTLPGWSGVSIYDGPPVTSDTPLLYAIIGWADGQPAGSLNSSVSPVGNNFLDESGSVACTLVSRTGDVAVPTMRTSVFDLVGQLEFYIAAHQSLGGTLSVNATCSLTVDVQSFQNKAGSAQELVVHVHYDTYVVEPVGGLYGQYVYGGGPYGGSFV